MRIYPFKCNKCKIYREDVRCWENAGDLMECPECRGPMMRVWTSLNFNMDFTESYYDHGLGEVVTSKAHRRYLMRAKGLAEIGNEHPSSVVTKKELNWDHLMSKVHKEFGDSMYIPDKNE